MQVKANSPKVGDCASLLFQIIDRAYSSETVNEQSERVRHQSALNLQRFHLKHCDAFVLHHFSNLLSKSLQMYFYCWIQKSNVSTD